MTFKKLKYWFDKELAVLLADKISAVNPSFKKGAFIITIDKGIQELELKDRVEYIADVFYKEFKEYEKGISILMQILGPENEEETGMFKEYYWIMPIAKFVEKYGLDNFDISMKAIEEITKRNTGEYAIRPFLEKYPKKTIKVLLQWSKNKNKHVRRLASEGGRPRLPWASKLQQFIDNPELLLPILENLKDDSSKYIQKSVANCINDILKDNYTIGKLLINGWVTNATKERKWIMKHALRNLLKRDDKWAVSTIKKL